MEKQEWSYSELEKEAIKDIKRSLVDMILAGSRSTVDSKFYEQEKDATSLKGKMNPIEESDKQIEEIKNG